MDRRNSERDILSEALAQLKQQGLSQQPPKPAVDETLRRLADAQPSDAKPDDRRSRRVFLGRMAAAAPLAAAALILVGFAIGRLSGPAAPDLDELREALVPSVTASIEPALRERLLADMGQRCQAALAHGFFKVREDLTQQYREDLTRYAFQTLAASNAVTNRLLAEVIENIDKAQTDDLTRIARAIHQIELNRVQDKTQLVTGLQTLASRTEDELSRTRQHVVQLFANYQPEGFDADPRPFQSFPERNEP